METLSTAPKQLSDFKPEVSVIIPCYNQGMYVIETLNSVLNQTYPSVEVIIVNDGSDDQNTSSVLQKIDCKTVRVIHTTNQGLAAARNNGILAAEGRLILPLDADDLIAPEYIEKAVAQLESNADVGIVYCRAELFGAVTTEWLLPPFSLSAMLLDNVIFCSAMFRKSDWEEVGGYDPGMIYGWEDYDFWLSLLELGREVYQIPEILFSYRVASDSMVRSKEKWQKAAMFKRIFERHQKLFADNIQVWINTLLDVHEKYYTSKLYVDTGNGVSNKDCISRKVDKGSAEIQFSLNDYRGIKAIRFDPVDSPVILEIIKIVLTDNKGESKVLTDYTNNCDFQINKDSFFSTDDPGYFLHLTPEELKSLVSVTVHLSFKALETEALARIALVQQSKLQDLSTRLNNMNSSGILKAVVKALVPLENENAFQYVKRQLKPF